MNSSKRNIHFIDDSPFGYVSNGRDNWLFNISKCLHTHCDINIHCRKPSGRRLFLNIKELEGLGVRTTRYAYTDSNNIIYRISNKLSFRILDHIRAFLFALRVFFYIKKSVCNGDIIFSLNPTSEALPGILLRKKKAVIDVCLMKGKPAYEATEATPFLEKVFFVLEKYFINNVRHLFSNASDTREYILSRYGRDTAIINNGVDLQEFRLLKERQLTDTEILIKRLKENGMKILLFVGTIHRRKGIEFIIDLPLFLDKIYSERYAIILVGKGRYDVYLDRIKKHRTEEKFYFVGEQKYIPFFYQNSDLSLHLTYSQLGMGGTSHATLEALASCNPIVAWNNRTYNQFLTSGIDSILVPEGNMEKLAMAVKTILEDEAMSSVLRRNSVKTAMRYDWQVVSEDLQRILNRLSNNNNQ